ncbi:MAG: polysaccharide biosynthesis protein [Prevotella sp.]|nr:polysaccharide biosynthesis protein [Prevotella sp.]
MRNKLIIRYFSRSSLPYWTIILIDCIIVVIAGMLATYAVTGGSSLASHFWHHIKTWLCAVPCFIIGMKLFHTYSGLMRYTATVDLIRIGYSVLAGGVILALCHFLAPQGTIIASMRLLTFFVMLMLTMMGQWAVRILAKYLYEIIYISNRKTGVFIYGAQDEAIAIAQSFTEPNSKYTLKGFVSIDGTLQSKYLMGLKVRRDGPNLISHMRESGASVLIVSPSQQDRFRNRLELQKNLIKAHIRIMVVPQAEDWNPTKAINSAQLKEVEIEDLLPRDKIEVDMPAIGAMLCGKRILITGAAGSIGSEMVKQIARYDPARLILIDQAETPMHDVRLYMEKKYPEIPCETIVGDITNRGHMERLFEAHRPEYVFHAAAYKHVPMMEDNPAMAVQNNIYGTRVIADLAVKYGTKKFVMISTDKAVNPTNVMGCSKRICEIYCQSLNNANPNLNPNGNGTQFITTRFGNVLGSNGSVIPLFRKQIKNGGPLTVTHPDIIRYFMLIPEACQLVLEAGTMGKGGEIFVFDMGKPVRIVDLAQRMIDLSGAKDVKIEFTGLRDGEKLYEEVLNDEELTKPTHHPKIKIAAVREYDYDVALKNEEELYQLSLGYDDMAIVKKMKEIVPEYRSQHSKYEVLDTIPA